MRRIGFSFDSSSVAFGDLNRRALPKKGQRVSRGVRVARPPRAPHASRHAASKISAPGVSEGDGDSARTRERERARTRERARAGRRRRRGSD
eukprot:30929-Pelagococcus_subviridis.AAC.4